MKLWTLIGMVLISSCSSAASVADQDVPSKAFPAANRPVSTIVSSRWSTEIARDQVKEAARVMDISGVAPGMSVADIGAGEGYYTIRLAARVGAKGRVLAQDIFPKVRETLAARVYREKLDNVSVTLGEPANPKLPPNSFDRIFLIHMYHEIETPYEFLWRMRPALRAGGEVVIVDANRPTQMHGTPPSLLTCELGAVGYQKVKTKPLPDQGIFLMAFTAKGPRPAPPAIKVCGAAAE